MYDERPGLPAWRAGGAGATVVLKEIGVSRPLESGRSADDREHVAGREDEQLLAGVLDLGAAVLAVDDLVADVHVERDPVAGKFFILCDVLSEVLILWRTTVK